MVANYNQTLFPSGANHIVSMLNCTNASDVGTQIKTMLGDALTYSFVISIPSLYEFSDNAGTAQFPGDGIAGYLSLSTLNWTIVDWSDASALIMSVGGEISFQIVSHDSSGRDSDSPFLPYNDKSCVVALTISNYNYVEYVLFFLFGLFLFQRQWQARRHARDSIFKHGC